MSQEPPSAEPKGRATHVISQLYYYVAAVVGVGFVIGGAIAFLFGVRTLLLPDEFQEARDGFRQMLLGLSFVIPGLVAMWWHLREARRREANAASGGFWGAALYFHLVAFIAFGFVLGGSAAVLSSAADTALPQCYLSETAWSEAPPHGYFVNEAEVEGGRVCAEGAGARGIIDAAIFVIVAGPIMWWHLRQGRRLTAPSG